MVNLIRSAIARLTLSYLAIIMVLSITFSLVLYRASAHELDVELKRPTQLEIKQTIDPFSFERFRDARIAISSQNLKQALIIFNLGTLVVGSVISYLLARHTLEPVEEAIEAQGRFTADASHELRTPLTAMQIEIEVALRNRKLSAGEAKDLLKSNLEELGKLRSLSDGLLRLARSEQLDLKNIEVRPIVEEAIKQVQNLAKAKKIKLVKSEVTSFKVLADGQSLKDILVILLDNAIKYSPVGAEVTINSRKNDGHGEITVSDQGIGIKSKDLPHIFERFFRADQSRSSQIDGHGLGLSIAKQLVESQKGQITAVSKLGEGSTFTIKLST